ncbi:hypothetical protein C9374_004665 [Naegleria lovaniensis]|uniref:Phosphatidylinositol N-acetylglucosaminyltransferase subunit Q n=1 Tax=Naegleria lovaniensis TaxID=51637 RepID=A0AA88KKS1_NAELO|nr:uncharacterized protein C9374_004665 [Naegleria lovaniensis]KAG2383328.1 hypothetical protein C9374_004665 [Naegleria lovaniensis]
MGVIIDHPSSHDNFLQQPNTTSVDVVIKKVVRQSDFKHGKLSQQDTLVGKIKFEMDSNDSESQNYCNLTRNNCLQDGQEKIFIVLRVDTRTHSLKICNLFLNGIDICRTNSVGIYCIYYQDGVKYNSYTKDGEMSESCTTFLDCINNESNNTKIEKTHSYLEEEHQSLIGSTWWRCISSRIHDPITLNSIVDIILGFLFAYFIYSLYYTDAFSKAKNQFLIIYEGFFKMVVNHFEWLIRDSNPGGFKLNRQLNLLLGNMAIGGITWWKSLFELCYSLVADNETVILLSKNLTLTVVIACCMTGFSTLIAAVSDCFMLASVNILLFYRITRRLYSQLIQITLSLWRLFRGKKNNPLRKRLDNCDDYSNEQLVLGTILFTICIFLYFTVAVYYFTFAFLFYMLVIIRKTLFSVIVFIHNFPIATLLNINGRRNRGVYYQHLFTDPTTNTSYLKMTSTTMSLSETMQPLKQQLLTQVINANTCPAHQDHLEETSSNVIVRLLFGYPLFYH